MEAMLNVLKSGWVSEGKITEKFQKNLSDYISSKVILVNNGSSALMAALIANGVKPGDKVLVPAFTYIATASIPKILGLKIIVSDVNEKTLNMDPETAEEMIKKHKPSVVMLVDVAGAPADIEGFEDLSKRHNFKLIEDAAQSFGAEYKNKKLGSFNHLTTFSFQIAKQLTTIEGGCVSSLDENLMKKIRKIKDYGRSKIDQYVHDFIGTNFRTTDLQSSIGIKQLEKIEDHILRRNDIAVQYKKNIKSLRFQEVFPFVSRHSYMLFFALANNLVERDNILSKLRNQGIDARKSWTPIHKQPYDLVSDSLECPNAEKNL